MLYFILVFEESLEKNIRSYSGITVLRFFYTGDFERFMVDLASAKRDESSRVDVAAAKSLAEKIFQNGIIFR